MSVEYDNRLKKIHDDAFPLNYILPSLALVALVFLIVTFIFNKDKEEHKTEVFPQLKEHRIRLIRPDGTVDKIVTVKNYDNTSKVCSGKAGNLYVSDYTDNNYEYVAPIGWNLEIVNLSEE